MAISPDRPVDHEFGDKTEMYTLDFLETPYDEN